MKIIVDENIPFGKEAFSTIGEVELFAGRKIRSSMVKNADVLIVRSITKVDESLLENSKIKFVGTATIGTDHIDQEYLTKKGIVFSSAAGCNSYSVAEYVFAAITYIANKYNFNFENKSIGVIGYGNIGTKIARIADAIGMKTVINDPPLERKSAEGNFATLEEALECDIVTFHVPLNKTGTDKTVHLLNEENLGRVKENAILINASRGAVISNDALKNELRKRKIYTVLDVWESEPNFDSELLRLTELATPHIAGYSYEGKVNGTTMIYNALCDFAKATKTWNPVLEKVSNPVIELNESMSIKNIFSELFSRSYRITVDDNNLRESIDFTEEKRAEHFDMLRKTYRKRRELNNFRVILNSQNERIINLLKALRVEI